MIINEIDYAITLAGVGAASYYGGFYFERRRACQAIRRIIRDSQNAIGNVASAAMGMMAKKNPESSVDALAREMVDELNKLGVKAVAHIADKG